MRKPLAFLICLVALVAACSSDQADTRDSVAAVAERLGLEWDAERAVRMEDDTLISWTSAGPPQGGPDDGWHG